MLKSLHTLSCHLINREIILIEIKHINLIVILKTNIVFSSKVKELIVPWSEKQVTPSPLNPALQAQLKLPTVFVHIPLVSSQLSVSVVHSLISVKSNNSNIIQIQSDKSWPSWRETFWWRHYAPCLSIWWIEKLYLKTTI